MKNRYKTGGFFHLFNKSIANFGIFKKGEEKERFLQTVDYYNTNERKISLSLYLENNKSYFYDLLTPKERGFVKFLAYCVMPDHYHLLVKIITDDVLSKYINDVENSFTRYFNLRNNRKGPLWQSNFKAVRIKSNEQLLHVIRYIHLNPTTNHIVVNPVDWIHSSYRLYLRDKRVLEEYMREVSIRSPQRFKRFTEDRVDYQRKLKAIRRLIFK